ncbi:hypothetical protein SEVIR_7G060402v4 [Setaria viridis]
MMRSFLFMQMHQLMTIIREPGVIFIHCDTLIINSHLQTWLTNAIAILAELDTGLLRGDWTSATLHNHSKNFGQQQQVLAGAPKPVPDLLPAGRRLEEFLPREWDQGGQCLHHANHRNHPVECHQSAHVMVSFV